MRLRIVAPCHQDFAAMPGQGATRSCAECNKSVHDLSRATPSEVRAFAADHVGRRACVRVGVAALAIAATTALSACSAADQGVQPVVQIGPLQPAPPKPDAGPADEPMVLGEMVSDPYH
jgi:hypothetical protein